MKNVISTASRRVRRKRRVQESEIETERFIGKRGNFRDCLEVHSRLFGRI